MWVKMWLDLYIFVKRLLLFLKNISILDKILIIITFIFVQVIILNSVTLIIKNLSIKILLSLLSSQNILDIPLTII